MYTGTTAEFEDRVAVQSAPTCVAGLGAGTMIMTLDGEVPVEGLTPGQRVITRDAGMAILREVRETRSRVASVQIMAGSLGHTRPEHDMHIGPDTLVHIRDWRARALFNADVATVKAKRLLDGEFVTQGAATVATVHELVFDRQHIFYADGLEVASAPV